MNEGLVLMLIFNILYINFIFSNFYFLLSIRYNIEFIFFIKYYHNHFCIIIFSWFTIFINSNTCFMFLRVSKVFINPIPVPPLSLWVVLGIFLIYAMYLFQIQFLNHIYKLSIVRLFFLFLLKCFYYYY